MEKPILLCLFILPVIASHAMKEENQLESWKIHKTFKYDKELRSATQNNNILLTRCYDDNNAFLTNLDTLEKESLSLSHTSIWNPVIDLSAHYILSGPHSHEVTLSKVNGEPAITFAIDSENYMNATVHATDFNAQGNRILITSLGKVTLCDLEGKNITQCEPGNTINFAQFFPNDEHLIFIAHHGIKLWDIRTKDLIIHKSAPIMQADINQEGTAIALIREHEWVAEIYDFRNEKKMYLRHASKPSSVHFNASGSHILANYYGYTVAAAVAAWCMKNVTSGQDTDGYKTFYKDNICSGSFHPDGNQVLTYSRKTIYSHENNSTVWDLDAQQIATLPHDKTIYSAQFDATGKYIVSTHENNLLNIYKNQKDSK